MQRALNVMESAIGPDVEPIFEGARCLAYLEIEMERTSSLFAQLAGLHDLADRSHQYQWGLGLVQAWNGDVAGARQALGRAIELASARGDHWAVFECTARLALLELDVGDPATAGSLTGRLAEVAGEFGGGSEPAYATAIAALHGLAVGTSTEGSLHAAVAELERLDAQFLLPDLLGIAAQIELRHADLDRARSWAERALEVAEKFDRPNEAARASAVLAAAAAAAGRSDEASARVAAVRAVGTPLPATVEHLLSEASRLGTSEPELER
jgi:tetratricopeptide (TPR) repeat protein